MYRYYIICIYIIYIYIYIYIYFTALIVAYNCAANAVSYGAFNELRGFLNYVYCLLIFFPLLVQ